MAIDQDSNPFEIQVGGPIDTDTKNLILSQYRDTQSGEVKSVILPSAIDPNFMQVVDGILSETEEPQRTMNMPAFISAIDDADLRQNFWRSCTAEDLAAFEHMKSPTIVQDPDHSDQYIVLDRGATIIGMNYASTVSALQGMGLELWSDRLLEVLKIDLEWTWLQPETRKVDVGLALRGGCRGGRPIVFVSDSGRSGPDLAGRGLRRGHWL